MGLRISRRPLFMLAFKGLKQGTEELGIFFITPVADVRIQCKTNFWFYRKITKNSRARRRIGTSG